MRQVLRCNRCTRIVALALLVWAITAAGQCFAADDPWTKMVNLEVKDVPLSDAIENLLKDSGISYTIDPGVSHLRVTAVLRNVTLSKALGEIIQAAGATYGPPRDGVISIKAARPPVGSYGLVAPETDAVANSAGGPTTTEKITLSFAEPADVTPLLLLEPGVQIASTTPDAVVVKGDPKAIDRARSLIRMMDTPDAFARLVRVRLVAVVTVPGTEGKVSTYRAASESAGMEGSRMPMDVCVRVAGSEELRVSANLVPSLQSAGSDGKGTAVGLVGSGAIDGNVMMASSERFDGTVLMNFSKKFDVAVSVEPRKETVIAAGSADMGGGEVRFEVSASASVEPGRVKRAGGMRFPGFGVDATMPSFCPPELQEAVERLQQLLPGFNRGGGGGGR